MNIFYIGSSGALSLIPFKKLLASGFDVDVDVDVVAVGVYQPIVFQQKIFALQNESLALAARQADIPVIDLSQPLPEIIKQCSEFDIDLTLMSCYSKRLPDALIKLASKGSYNMHPSLLPAYRGPEPIFWQMQQASDMGVSWHEVTSEFDAGDIAVQKKINLDDGMTFDEISQQLALSGADLLPGLLADILEGSVHSIKQKEDKSSYFMYPQASDFVIDTSFDARQLYNFMCATQKFGNVYRYQYKENVLYLTEAIDFDNNLSLDCPEVQSHRVYVPCNDGVLIASYTDKIHT